MIRPMALAACAALAAFSIQAAAAVEVTETVTTAALKVDPKVFPVADHTSTIGAAL